ncbi:MAG: hypothetical protein EBR82_27385 [Caulobacteraceae bacterium]|nr:hypothetical protein [Caulobacteraceae bacterium]
MIPAPDSEQGITPEEVTILACLLTGDQTVRLWAQRMGVPASIMGHTRLREMYDTLVMDGDVGESPVLSKLLDRPLPDHCAPHRTLFTAAKYYDDMPGFEPRLQAFQRCVRKRMNRWAPDILRFIAGKIQDGTEGKDVQHAAELLAFAAWTQTHAGPWVYRPGEEVSQ